MRCTREHLITLSDFLNRLFDFEAGEDFDKLADEPRPALRLTGGEGDGSDDGGEADCGDICKTDRAAICMHLDWMCRHLQKEPNLSTVGQNKIRLLQKLIGKLSAPPKGGTKGKKA